MTPRWWRRLRGRLAPALLSDGAFVERAYRDVLGRPPDRDGWDYYATALREGQDRLSVLVSLVESEEYTSRLVRRGTSPPDIRPLRPAQYRLDQDVVSRTMVPVFEVRGPADYDWLESAIEDNAYYEQPGVWNLGVDTDKRVMAEVVASFAPERALEVGCASGAVLSCLGELGVEAEGVEICALALEKASPEVRRRIHAGDLLEVPLAGPYDLVYGLDVFEHLNPNRLPAYLERLTSLLAPSAWVFANVPAFGPDEGFGTVFPPYLRGWEGAPRGRLYPLLHVDDRGYPLHGHLAWADSPWWVARFEEQGLVREGPVEAALHARYDDYMDRHSRARKAYYVFSRGVDEAERQRVRERIASTPSQALR